MLNVIVKNIMPCPLYDGYFCDDDDDDDGPTAPPVPMPEPEPEEEEIVLGI